MKRGEFNYLTTNNQYKNSKKEWKVEIEDSRLIWLNNNLIINKNEYEKECLKQLKKINNANFQKNFIYFIASRERVRFDLKKPNKYSAENKNLILHLKFGTQKKIIKIELKEKIMIDFKLSEREIIFYYEDGIKYYNIHDLLIEFRINLGFNTEINYVGITSNPEDRPIGKKHRGLTDVLININDEEEKKDIFIIYNLFKVFCDTRKSNSQIVYLIPNSLTSEIDLKKEGGILENSLIMYFSCRVQELNKEREQSRLLNLLRKDMKEKKIDRIAFYFENNDISEYFNFIDERKEICKYFEIYEQNQEIIINKNSKCL